MAYAVTCKSCGARFSVANDLVQKRMGSELALRCKRCHEPIRFTPSHPPAPLPEPARAAPTRPRPPLKKQPAAESKPQPASLSAKPPVRRAPPPRSAPRSFVALDPGLLPARKGVEHDLFEPPPEDVEHDLFEPPPPSHPGAVDLSDVAQSEPPSRLSSAPPLFDLTHNEAPNGAAAHEDIDFLLGLRGSPGTTAALQSPSFADLTRKPPSEPPLPIHVDEPSTETPSAVALPKGEAIVAEKSRRKSPALLLALGALGISGAVLAASALTPRAANETRIESAPTSSASARPVATAAVTTPSEPVPSASIAAPLPTQAKPTRSTNAKAHADRPTASAAPASEAPARPAAQAAPTPHEPVGAGFDRAAAVSALATQAAQASKCRKDGDPSGTATVTITFAPSGRVTSANVSGPPFAGTPTGGCIAAALRRAHIPPFDGEKVTVSKTVTIQ